MRPSSADHSAAQTLAPGPPTPFVAGAPVRDSRLRSATVDHGPPIGHVIGHRIGESPPRPRDPNRPSGRIAPYADVVVHSEVRPLFTV
jgi:hypothetical protein